jgi:hypothetical protein
MHCSETEHFEGDSNGQREIWIFKYLIYDLQKRGAREQDPNRATIKRKLPNCSSGRTDDAACQ